MGLSLSLAVATIVFTFSAICLNLAWFTNFARLFRSPSSPVKGSGSFPRTLIMLCLRGRDPFLKETLLALSRQTETNFDLRVVIDHPDDSSVAVVEQFQQETGFSRLQIRYLHHRRQTCSLKASALLQELTDVDKSYEVIVQIDADAVPYPGWLAEMVSPLRDPQVGAVSGLRWYMPYQSNWASLIRYIWGISATVQMVRFGMPWGGSLAFRRELLERTNLLERWRNSLSEDLVLASVLQESGLRLEFVPAVMVNREETSLRDCYSFVSRQVLMARHYHPAWPKIGSFALLNALTILCPILLALTAVKAQVGYLIHVAWILPLMYSRCYGMMIAWSERLIRQKVTQQSGVITPMDYRYRLAQPLALILHTIASGAALVCRRVNWRGVAYKISQGGRVQLLRDEPSLFRGNHSGQASIV